MNFMLLALPRSGTAWAANWLMDRALCYHDPFSQFSPEQLTEMKHPFTWGVSCTFGWALPDYVAMQKCPYVIIDRNIDEVNRSIKSLCGNPLSDWMIEKFRKFEGPRFKHEELFKLDSAREIWNILRPETPHNDDRHSVLSGMNIQVDFGKWSFDKEIARSIFEKLNANC